MGSLGYDTLLKAHKDNGGLRQAEPGGIKGASKPVKPTGLKDVARKQGCRHLVRKTTERPPSPQTESHTMDAKTLEREHKLQDLNAWRQVNTHICDKGNAWTGSRCEMNTHTGLSDTITGASINTRGLNDV